MWYVKDLSSYDSRRNKFVGSVCYCFSNLDNVSQLNIVLKDSVSGREISEIMGLSELVDFCNQYKPHGYVVFQGISRVVYYITRIGVSGFNFLDFVERIVSVDDTSDKGFRKFVKRRGLNTATTYTHADELCTLFYVDSGLCSSLFDILSNRVNAWGSDCAYLFSGRKRLQDGREIAQGYRVEFSDIEGARRFITKASILTRSC